MPSVESSIQQANSSGIPGWSLSRLLIYLDSLRDFLARDEGSRSREAVPMHHGVPMVEKGWMDKRYECETCGHVTYLSSSNLM